MDNENNLFSNEFNTGLTLSRDLFRRQDTIGAVAAAVENMQIRVYAEPRTETVLPAICNSKAILYKMETTL